MSELMNTGFDVVCSSSVVLTACICAGDVVPIVRFQVGSMYTPATVSRIDATLPIPYSIISSSLLIPLLPILWRVMIVVRYCKLIHRHTCARVKADCVAIATPPPRNPPLHPHQNQRHM